MKDICTFPADRIAASDSDFRARSAISARPVQQRCRLVGQRRARIQRQRIYIDILVRAFTMRSRLGSRERAVRAATLKKRVIFQRLSARICAAEEQERTFVNGFLIGFSDARRKSAVPLRRVFALLALVSRPVKGHGALPKASSLT